MIERTFIYAFKYNGVILYVGQTVDPQTRRFFHLHATASKLRKKLPRGAEFVILRQTTTDKSFQIERQIITNLRKKGQAKLNRRNACRNGVLVGGYHGPLFKSLAQSERLKNNSK